MIDSTMLGPNPSHWLREERRARDEYQLVLRRSARRSPLRMPRVARTAQRGATALLHGVRPLGGRAARSRTVQGCAPAGAAVGGSCC